MHEFQYKNGQLHAEGVSLKSIAAKVGTPFYCYSATTLTRHFDAFDHPLSPLLHLICFSMKANSNVAVLNLMVKKGAGVDIVSGGELYRALIAGASPAKIVFSGVGKTDEEIGYALRQKILMFNVESEEELRRISSIAKKMKAAAPIAIRVNPNIDAKTHPYISTGLKKSKFGIQTDASLKLYHEAKRLPGIKIVGIDCHIGSQLTTLAPMIEALSRVKILYRKLAEMGIPIRLIDLGGGLGITYKDEVPPHPTEYARAIIDAAAGLPATFIFEPGRVIVGNAGILVTKVLYRKRQGKRRFLIVDAAMNDLIRPALYDSYQELLPVTQKNGRRETLDVVGPICESGDFFAKGRRFPWLKAGSLVSIMSAGAYGFTMASNYNSRPRIPEVMVRGDRFMVVRERENYRDLLRGEKIPKFLN